MPSPMHIVRPTPITFDEWSDYVASDLEMTLIDVSFSVNNHGQVVCIDAEDQAVWETSDGNEHFFAFSDGYIVVEASSPAVIAKAQAVASRLGATVRSTTDIFYR